MLRSLVGIRIQVFFTPLPGCFSPFPHGTLLYRSSDIFSLGPWSARLQTEFHVLRPTQVLCPGRLAVFAYGAFTLSGGLSQYPSTNRTLVNCPTALQSPPTQPFYPVLRNACRLARTRFRLRPFRSPLLRPSLRFLLSPATEMFHFAGFASTPVDLQPSLEGFPHSDIPGSSTACLSPGRFAARCVLLRCQMPWHPPYALFPLLPNSSLPSISPVNRIRVITGGIQRPGRFLPSVLIGS